MFVDGVLTSGLFIRGWITLLLFFSGMSFNMQEIRLLELIHKISLLVCTNLYLHLIASTGEALCLTVL